MKNAIKLGILGSCLLVFGATAPAQGLKDALGSKLGGSAGDTSALGGALGGGGGLAAMGLATPGTAGNAAGVITYCMKNNYLNADKAGQVKDQLLGKMGVSPKQEPKDEGYLRGVSGMVTGSDGQSFSLDKVKGDVKEKACDLVLDNAQSLL